MVAIARCGSAQSGNHRAGGKTGIRSAFEQGWPRFQYVPDGAGFSNGIITPHGGFGPDCPQRTAIGKNTKPFSSNDSINTIRLDGLPSPSTVANAIAVGSLDSVFSAWASQWAKISWGWDGGINGVVIDYSVNNLRPLYKKHPINKLI